MARHDYLEPDGSFWRGLCPKCAKPREHPIHAAAERAEPAVSVVGVSVRELAVPQMKRSA